MESLTNELLLRSEQDQVMRNKNLADNNFWDESIDKNNTLFLKKIIKKYGWPTISMVGQQASDAAWLLVQHADHDTKFQEYCLNLIKTIPKKEINQSHIAYLEDRVLVAKGLPQKYGTQFFGIGKDLKPRQIEDKKNVDKRRAKMNLSKFAEYEKLMNETYNKKPKIS